MSCARLRLLLIVVPAVPSLAAGQSVAAGRVIRTGADSLPAAGARVLLHRVGRGVQGPVDSVITDQRGAFRFRFKADTTAVYLTSSRYAGIEYFSPAVHLDPTRPDTALRILVSDTSSRVPIELAARHIVVADPGQDGNRGVLDLIVLQNRGDRTLVAPDTVHPAWSAPLPAGTFGLEPGEGDVSPEALRREGDRVLLLAPIAPGEKQLILQYDLPAAVRTMTLPFETSAGFVNVLVTDPSARVTGGALAPADTEVIQGRTYRRWMGQVPAGSTVRIELAGPFRAPPWALRALVGGLAAGLALAAVRALRPPGGSRPASWEGVDVDVMLERAAQLDARFVGRESETEPVEWSRYRAERAELMTRLEALRAARSGRA
ncbi:MAG TPA: hypothetical protein VIE46_09250 [Gemmatimonadales bacterium]